ncbi:MAG: GYF domain-containing protein [Opitutia bacterium]|jgi:hypothetical protein
MEIHLARDGSSLGVFTEPEVREGLAGGRFRPSDLAWRQGMSTWTPLANWPEFAGVAAPGLPGSAPVPEPRPAWERGASFRNFFGTLYDVILNPVATFDALPRGNLGKVVGFQYAAGLPSWLCGSILWGALLAILAAAGSQDAALLEGFASELGDMAPLALGAAVCLFLGCVLVMLPLFTLVGAAIQHLAILPWGPAGGFGQTYRVAGYVQGSFLPFSFIPCLNYLAGPWSLVTSIIALSRVHRLAWWKVVLSWIFLMCCIGGLLVALMVGGSGLAG